MTEVIIKSMRRKGYVLYTRPFELNIVGIRNNLSIPNSFDDSIAVFYTDNNGQWNLHQFKATTNPGSYWLRDPMTPKGTAILKPGQYVSSYRIGMHRQKYKALVQQLPVTVIRDNNHDEIPDFDNKKEETGLFGINIHGAAENGLTKYIDKYSAGCQVLADAADFNVLMTLAEKHRQLYGNRFTYTLLGREDGETESPEVGIPEVRR